jgi:hypothetical protein
LTLRGNLYFVDTKQQSIATRAETKVRSTMRYNVNALWEHSAVVSNAMNNVLEQQASDSEAPSEQSRLHPRDTEASMGRATVPASGAPIGTGQIAAAMANAEDSTAQVARAPGDPVDVPTSDSLLLADTRPAEECDFRPLLTAYRRCIVATYYVHRHCADILCTTSEDALLAHTHASSTALRWTPTTLRRAERAFVYSDCRCHQNICHRSGRASPTSRGQLGQVRGRGCQGAGAAAAHEDWMGRRDCAAGAGCARGCARGPWRVGTSRYAGAASAHEHGDGDAACSLQDQADESPACSSPARAGESKAHGSARTRQWRWKNSLIAQCHGLLAKARGLRPSRRRAARE